jgi:hypothetical protein
VEAWWQHRIDDQSKAIKQDGPYLTFMRGLREGGPFIGKLAGNELINADSPFIDWGSRSWFPTISVGFWGDCQIYKNLFLLGF